MRIIKRVMVAIGAPCAFYMSAHVSYACTHVRVYLRVCGTGRRDPSGAQLEIRGPLFVVLVFRISPSGTGDVVSGDRIYGLAGSTWNEYQEILVARLEISLLIVHIGHGLDFQRRAAPLDFS